MTVSEVAQALNTLAALAAALLGVSVTLAALIPTLIQLVRANSPDFLSQLDQEISLKRVMAFLAITVLNFGFSLSCALVGIFCKWSGWLWMGFGTFILGLVILIATSVMVSLTAREIM